MCVSAVKGTSASGSKTFPGAPCAQWLTVAWLTLHTSQQNVSRQLVILPFRAPLGA